MNAEDKDQIIREIVLIKKWLLIIALFTGFTFFSVLFIHIF